MNIADRPRQRFRRGDRLRRPAEFDRVFAHSRRSRDQWFTVLFSRNRLERPRLGLVVARRRIRQAAARNRVKRVVRESFRRQAGTLPAVDIVVIAGERAGTASNAQLFASLCRHYRAIAGERQG